MFVSDCFCFLCYTNKPADASVIVSSSGIVHEENSGTVGIGAAIVLVDEGVGFDEIEIETEPSGMV